MDYKKAWNELMKLLLEREQAYIAYDRKKKLQELTNTINQMKNIEESYNRDCGKCKEQEECDIYQDWLNTRDCCCPKNK